jgi:hypothetical protein
MNIFKFTRIISSVSFFCVATTSVQLLAVAPRTVDRMDNLLVEELQSPLPGALALDNEEWFFSRYAVMIAPFAEIDLELIELKIQPYVELRFDRNKAK